MPCSSEQSSGDKSILNHRGICQTAGESGDEDGSNRCWRNLFYFWEGRFWREMTEGGRDGPWQDREECGGVKRRASPIQPDLLLKRSMPKSGKSALHQIGLGC